MKLAVKTGKKRMIASRVRGARPAPSRATRGDGEARIDADYGEIVFRLCSGVGFSSAVGTGAMSL